MFLSRRKIKRRLADGRIKVYTFYQLLEAVWDKKERRNRQRYIAYVGKEPVLDFAKAKAICRRKKLKLEALKRVKGLKIAGPKRKKGEGG